MSMALHRILIVEDNPGDLRLIKEALRHYGLEYALMHYTTADAAIRALKNFAEDDDTVPDLIVLDYNVPRGDGREMLTAAVGNSVLKDIPKAILTSSMAREDHEQVMKLGADCFIIKPADLDDFLTQVGAALAGLLNRVARPTKAGI